MLIGKSPHSLTRLADMRQSSRAKPAAIPTLQQMLRSPSMRQRSLLASRSGCASALRAWHRGLGRDGLDCGSCGSPRPPCTIDYQTYIFSPTVAHHDAVPTGCLRCLRAFVRQRRAQAYPSKPIRLSATRPRLDRRVRTHAGDSAGEGARSIRRRENRPGAGSSAPRSRCRSPHPRLTLLLSPPAGYS